MVAVLGKSSWPVRCSRSNATKTRYVDFRTKRSPGHDPGATFDFLGFTHAWGRSRRGYTVVRQITAKSRFAHAMKSGEPLVQEAPARSAPGKAGASRPSHPGSLQVLRSDREQRTPIELPPPNHTHLAQVALTSQPEKPCELGPDAGTAPPVPTAASQGHALDLHVLSEPAMCGT